MILKIIKIKLTFDFYKNNKHEIDNSFRDQKWKTNP